MEKQQKLKYENSKYIVKKWESEFKKIRNQLPSKSDIKCAPSKIKDAYRTYWTLKNLTKTNVGNLSVDENAKDCFNSSDNNEPESNSFSQDLKYSEDSTSLAPLSETLSDSIISPSCSFSELSSPLTQDSNINKNNELTPTSFKNLFGTGKKINVDMPDFIREIAEKVQVDKEHKEEEKKLEKKSISFQYSEKLFVGSKFNKRNPRKPRDINRNKSISVEDLKTSVDDELNIKQTIKLSESKEINSLFQTEESDIVRLSQCDDLSSSSSKNLCIGNPQEDYDELDSSLFKEKIKVLTKETKKPIQAVSLLQKTFDDKNNKPSLFRKLDQGWLDRVNDTSSLEIKKDCQEVKSDSQDSGVESLKCESLIDPDSCIVSTESNIANDSIIDSEDEIICDSDSESQSQSLFRINLVDKVLNQSNSSFSELKSFDSSFQFNKPGKSENISNFKNIIISLRDNDKKNCFGIKKRAMTETINTEDPPLKKTKLLEKSKEYDFLSTTKPELILSYKTINQQKKTVNQKLSLANETKMQKLEDKLLSGKASENFVKINIEKKKFVRGRKTMTFSKYKKQKWKEMRESKGEYGGRGILKCFNCGDVSHFSKTCPKGKGLLPLEDYDSAEESPFPTLEEVSEMAKESAERVHKGKRQFKEDSLKLEPPEPDEASLGKFVRPLYQLEENGSVMDTPVEVFEALRDLGYSDFRPGQELGVMRILSGLSTVVTLSTGSGKSLIYQLPALMYNKAYPGCITLVISPLVSLMEDQVYCGSKKLPTACLHHNLTKKKREAVLESLKSKTLSVLLIAPESLSSWDSAKSLFNILPPVAFACIDEAHSVSQSSHNFRPSYLTICQVLREKLGISTLLGLTATASKATLDTVMSQLGLPPESPVISNQPVPDNLMLTVSSDTNRKESLIRLLHSERFSSCDSIIIYCTRREECDKVAAFLRTSLQKAGSASKKGRLSLHAEVYHAGLTAGRRNQVQNAFMSGKLRIVVATVAFGMGINKNDIRGIIHYNLPSSFESYVQEVGRAGRDGKPAHCHVFLDSTGHDLHELRKHIYSDTMDRHVLRRLLQLVFVSCDCSKKVDPQKSPISNGDASFGSPAGQECADPPVDYVISCHHEVAFPIESTVLSLDLPQEVISTLLAYLQLDKERWIKVLPLAYTKCKVTSYKGPRHLKHVAKTCPPLAMALAESPQFLDKSSIEFDVIALSRKINWDSGIVKHTLKQLEWSTENGKPTKTGIVVELSCLGFRVLAPGSLSDTRLDEALNLLHSKVQDHESSRLNQLKYLYDCLRKVSHKDISDVADEVDLPNCEKLKSIIRSYFTSENPLAGLQPFCDVIIDEESVAMDIRRLIGTHGSDVNFTGRSIARILHGISSPNFPPTVWGRTSFWRKHIDKDFRTLVSLANRQLVLLR